MPRLPPKALTDVRQKTEPQKRRILRQDKTSLLRYRLRPPIGRSWRQAELAQGSCAATRKHRVVFILPRRLCRSVAAAALVMTGVFVADTSHVAGAQGRLDAEYIATLAGIPIGRGNWVIEISEDKFTAAASGATIGLLRFFSPGHGTGAVQGSVSAGQPLPTSYAATITNNQKVDDVRMAFAGGNVKDVTVDPPTDPNPERIPVSEADRRNVLDPMTSTLDLVGGGGDPVSPQACGRKVPVFDGRMRYDLRSEFKRIEIVKADKGYHGPTVVCAVYFVPISGYLPDRYAIKYLAALRDAEVWLAPIFGTRVLVPFRFSLPTPIGTGVVQATQFISAAKQPRAAANVKAQ
jgi:hypothetical protein